MFSVWLFLDAFLGVFRSSVARQHAVHDPTTHQFHTVLPSFPVLLHHIMLFERRQGAMHSQICQARLTTQCIYGQPLDMRNETCTGTTLA